MPTYDFACSNDHEYEIRCSVADKDTVPHLCPECNSPGHSIIISAPHVCTVIVPTYPGSKAASAGYQHSHGPKSATKIQSGYGGSSSPKIMDANIARDYQPEVKNSLRGL
jgi:putative FmdB family regulatory protein